jgi:hypothetical protein
MHRREEEIALAEKYRLLKQNGSSKIAAEKSYQRLLIGLGGLMVEWGCRLQSRYETAAVPAIGDYITESNPSPCSS